MEFEVTRSPKGEKRHYTKGTVGQHLLLLVKCVAQSLSICHLKVWEVGPYLGL